MKKTSKHQVISIKGKLWWFGITLIDLEMTFKFRLDGSNVGQKSHVGISSRNQFYVNTVFGAHIQISAMRTSQLP
jgi:hypothetical protein